VRRTRFCRVVDVDGIDIEFVEHGRQRFRG
jgi:hypothetical protein